MISVAIRPVRQRRVTSQRLLGVLIVAVAIGLVWMHALSGGHHTSTTGMQPHAAPTTADACPGHDPSSPCPDDQPKHPGSVCQSGAVPGRP